MHLNKMKSILSLCSTQALFNQNPNEKPIDCEDDGTESAQINSFLISRGWKQGLQQCTVW